MVDCALYRVDINSDNQAVAAVEIEEARWVAMSDVRELELASLTRDVVFQLLRRDLSAR